MSDKRTHTSDCGWHVDQYPWECTCGAIPRKAAMDELIAASADELWAKHEREHLFDRIETQAREIERLREALRVMIYETTHLSPMEPDGSHWCRITADALNIARAALAGGSHD